MEYALKLENCQISDTTQHMTLINRFVKPLSYLMISSLAIFFSLQSRASEGQFPFKACFEQSAERFSLDPSFLAAVASVESSFNPQAISSSGALGLMQIKWPQTAKELGVNRRSDLFDPCLNIDAGANYLARLLDRFDSKLLALAAYYQGPSKIEKEGAIPSLSVFYIEKVLREEQLITELNELVKSGSCNLTAFQAISQSVHHPKERLRKASRWIKENHLFCSTPELIRLNNRLYELMGTADVKGELKSQINKAISQKSAQTKKSRGFPRLIQTPK